MMSIANFVRAAPFLLCLAAAAAAQERRPDPSRHFQRAREIGDTTAPGATFEFESSGYSYRIASNGAGRRTKGEDVRRFSLRLEGVDWIERVSYQEYQDNILLVWWVNDGGGAAAYVARLEQPSMRARWKQLVPALNVMAVREQGSLYLNGYGFLGRLDLGTGEYIWRLDHKESHDDFHRRGGREESGVGARKLALPSSDFGPPEFDGDTVIYREVGQYKRPPLKAVHVNRKSGKIVRIE